MLEYLSPPLPTSPSSVERLFEEGMEAAFPGWKRSEASLTTRIGGAVSLVAAQNNEAAADGATNIFRYLCANLHNIQPGEAECASGTATWDVTDTLGHTIPAGTVAVWRNGSGNAWAFENTEPIVIAAGSNSATGVAMRALNAGEGGNGISGPAIELAPPVNLTYVSSVTMTTETTGGTESEGDSEYLTKAARRLETLSPTPILPRDFNNLLTEHSNVGRAITLRAFNPTATVTHSTSISSSTTLISVTEAVAKLLLPGTEVSGTGIAAGTRVEEVKSVSAGEVTLTAAPTKTETSTLTFTGLTEQPGWSTSWITSTTGEALTEPEYEKEIQELLLSGVGYKLLTPAYTTIAVQGTVYVWPGTSSSLTSTIKASTEAAIKTYINPLTWGTGVGTNSSEWNNDPIVRLLNVEAAILKVPGVHYVSGVKLNEGSANIHMTNGIVVLPKLGTLAITMATG